MRRFTIFFSFLLLIGGSACSRTPEQKKAQFLASGKSYMASKDFVRAGFQFHNATKVAPKDPEPYYQMGLAHLERAGYGEAVAALVKATQLDPKHAGAQLKLAEVLAATHDRRLLEEGEKRLRDLVNTRPDDVDALATLAVVESQLEEPERAERRLEQTLEKFPQNLKAISALARLKLARKDFAGVEEVLKEALSKNPRSMDVALSLADFYVRTGRATEGEKQFRGALKLDPNHPRALLGLAALQAASGQKAEAEEIFKQLEKLPDKRYRHLHAAFLFMDGRKEEAIAEFEKLANQDRADRGARSRLVAAYLMTNRTSEAEKLLNSTLKANPRDADALLQRSEILLKAGKLKEAEQDLTTSLRYKPDSGEAHYLFAKIHRARGEVLLQRQALTDAVLRNPKLLDARIDLARNLLGANSAKAALDVIRDAPQEQKATIPYIVQRNWVLRVMGNWDEFGKGVAAGLALGRTPDLLSQEALLKIQKRDFAGAVSNGQEALKQNPEHILALSTLALTYTLQSQTSTAFEKLRDYSARWPKLARVQHFFGEWALANGYREEARRAFVAAKAAEPTFLEADLDLAELDFSEARPEAARGSLTTLLASNPGNVHARLLLGHVENQAGNHAAAIDHYRKVLEDNPRHWVALNNLAYLLADSANQPDEALKYAQQAAELAPDHVDVEGTIGWIFYLKALYPTALQYLQKAASKDGTSAESAPAIRKYHLAMTYLKLGDRELGRRILEAALKLNPNTREAQMAQQLLRETIGANK